MGKFLPSAALPDARSANESVAVSESLKAEQSAIKAFTPSRIFKGKKAYSVQLGAYASIENAAKSMVEWQSKGYEAYVCKIENVEKQVRFAVRTGAFSKRQEAAALVKSLARRDDVLALLVPAVLDNAGRLAVVDVAALN
jgi:cell division septation protein DedD